MRGFVSLLFAVALAAHLGPAGAPSLGGSPVCSEDMGVGGRTGPHVLHPATAPAATQAEATGDGREGTGGAPPRRAAPQSLASTPRPVGGSAPRRFQVSTAASLLGFAGHPATAPPQQA